LHFIRHGKIDFPADDLLLEWQSKVAKVLEPAAIEESLSSLQRDDLYPFMLVTTWQNHLEMQFL